jgi:probable HAF family extracellular repeat protein
MTLTYVSIDEPSATDGTHATGINNKGQIIGYFVDSTGLDNGFLDTKGTFVEFDDPSGTFGTVPLGINNSITINSVASFLIVGKYLTGFFFNDFAAFINFGASPSYFGPPTSTLFPPDANGNVVTGINEKATEIVGWYINGNGVGESVSLLNNRAETVSTLALLGPGGTYANGVNNAGQIVGDYIDSSGHAHGFLYRPSSGTYKTLNDPHGTEGTYAVGINDNGQIVGYYVDSSGVDHGFLYTISTGHFTTLNDPLAGTGVGQGTMVEGINDKTEVVGTYIDSSGVHHGFHVLV